MSRIEQREYLISNITLQIGSRVSQSMYVSGDMYAGICRNVVNTKRKRVL